MTSTAKRVGRPTKPPTPGKRTTLSLMVSPDLKQRVDEAARISGRTQSQEAEALIEQGLAVRDVLSATRVTVPAVARRIAEANFRQRGYSWIHTPQGKIWLPPGHPATPPKSGFIPPEEEQK